MPGLLGEGLEFVSARPGELVDLYATSFGATDPPVEPGELPDSLANVVGTVAASVDGLDVPAEDILYVGATQWAGVYLLRIPLPAGLTAGEHVVRVTINGFQSPPGYIEVGDSEGAGFGLPLKARSDQGRGLPIGPNRVTSCKSLALIGIDAAQSCSAAADAFLPRRFR